jgi:hypothetical protein
MKKCFRQAAKLVVATLVVATVMGAAQMASAALSSSWTGSTTDPQAGNVYLSARADFVTTGNSLQITLTNTSTASTPGIADLLTTLTFTSSGTETGGSAVVAAGSYLVNGGSNNIVVKTPAGGTSVNNGWGYGTSGSTKIVEASGRLSGVGQAFDGTNLDGGAYGLLSTSTGTLEDGLTNSNHQPIIMNSVVITLAGLNAGNIANVMFYWGTGSGEPSTPGTPVPPGGPGATVPEPTSLAVWGLVSAATAGAVAMRKQKRGRGRWSNANRNAIYQVIGGKTGI